MNSTKATARLAGLLYLVMAGLMVIGYMVVPGMFTVPGDAAATARKIIDGTQMYRVGVLSALVSQFLFIVVVLTLYDLFKDVDRRHARLMVAWVCAGVAVEIVNLAYRMAPLILLSGADFLSVFNQPQLDALALGSIRLGNTLGQLVSAIWGLWLFPFGILAIRSGFFPRILGFLLFAAGLSWVVTCLTSLVFPAHRGLVTQFMMPLHFGELGIVFWMLIMGAKVPRVEAQPRSA